MSSVVVITILLAFSSVTLLHARVDAADRGPRDADDSRDTLASAILDRWRETPSLYREADLDNATIGRPGHLARSTLRANPSHLLPARHAQAMDPYTGSEPLQRDYGRFQLLRKPSPSQSGRYPSEATAALEAEGLQLGGSLSRRSALAASVLGVLPLLHFSSGLPARAAEGTNYEKNEQLYGKNYGENVGKDFTRTSSGLLIKDITAGTGNAPAKGDRCVIDWTGYTIGYDGRPFETKQATQRSGMPEGYLRFELGSGSVIPAFEEAIAGLSEGGVRQLIVERAELSYPADDPTHDRVGPKPATFGGQRALDSVLQNANRDKTLLFNVKLIRVDKPGMNGYKTESLVEPMDNHAGTAVAGSLGVVSLLLVTLVGLVAFRGLHEQMREVREPLIKET